ALRRGRDALAVAAEIVGRAGDVGAGGGLRGGLARLAGPIGLAEAIAAVGVLGASAVAGAHVARLVAERVTGLRGTLVDAGRREHGNCKKDDSPPPHPAPPPGPEGGDCATARQPARWAGAGTGLSATSRIGTSRCLKQIAGITTDFRSLPKSGPGLGSS